MQNIEWNKKSIFVMIILISLIILLIFWFNSKHFYLLRINHYIRDNNEKMVEKLLEKPKDINFSFSYMNDRVVAAPIEVAALHGNPVIVKMLLEKGAKADSIGMAGNSALMSACRGRYDYEKQKEIITLLLEYGADVNREEATTPFGFFLSNHGRERYQDYFDRDQDYPEIRQEKYEILLLFMEYGLDIENDGKYYLNDAASRRTIDVVIYFVEEAGLDADIKIPNSGKTPLMRASQVNATEVVEYLLDQGADKNIKDNDGRTAIDYARKYNAHGVIEILEENE